MRLRFSLSVISAAALLLSFTGCSASEANVTAISDPVEISFSWWGNDARHEYTLEAIKLFEELHPDIKVKCNYTEWSGYQTRSNVQMMSSTESDVMQINYAWIEQYSPDGDGYYDLNRLASQLDLSKFGEYELSFGMQNGKLNAIPIAMNTQTLYINRSVYSNYGLDVPNTWEDIFNAAEVMKADEVYPISMGSKPAFFYLTAYAEQVSGKKFMDLDGHLDFGPEDFKVMLEFYCRLVNEGAMPQVEYYDRTQIDSGKYAGTVAWLSDGTNYCGKAIGNGYELVVANYPADDTLRSGEGWYAKPATMYAISKNTSYPEESALLLDFLLNSKEMAQLQGVEKGIPLSSSARECLAENDLLNGMQYEAFIKMSEYNEKLSVLSPYFENDALIDEFRDACNQVLFEKSDIDEQAEAIYNTFADALGNN